MNAPASAPLLANAAAGLVLSLLMVVQAFSLACAQDYPTKGLRFVVPFPPGGGNDILARLLGQSLAESLGQPVVVDNRPGAGTIIGTHIAANAPPDGYTIFGFRQMGARHRADRLEIGSSEVKE